MPAIEEKEPDTMAFDLADAYLLSEVREIYNVSPMALSAIIKRFNIPKIKKGSVVYVPKIMITEVLGSKE